MSEASDAGAAGSGRIVVVGASSGLGRSIGTGLAERGRRVALLARRGDRVTSAAAGLDGAVGVECDVRDEGACERAVAEAAGALGGIDGLVYASGVGPLARLADSSADLWRSVLETNVMGASLITRAALPFLHSSRGRAVYLSSVSASVTPPWPGLGAYAASKAALDKMIEAWRGEHPDVGFTRLVVGDTAGGSGENATEFASTWDGELFEELYPAWAAKGLLTGRLVSITDLVDVVDLLFSSGADIPSVVVSTRGPGGT